jgi:hypothetical protein
MKSCPADGLTLKRVRAGWYRCEGCGQYWRLVYGTLRGPYQRPAENPVQPASAEETQLLDYLRTIGGEKLVDYYQKSPPNIKEAMRKAWRLRAGIE